ncbi:MAG: hypothetical protein HMLKMBBP_00540 [Planctomycetes bacterium]|nr:hypothetical protein [Planctomycetota bacterium]
MRNALGFIGVCAAASLMGLEARAETEAPEGRPIVVRERLTQTLRARGGRSVTAVEFRDRRMASLVLRTSLPGVAATLADGSAPVGLRVGDMSLEATLGDDPRWRPGRRHARVPLPAADAATRPGSIAISWSRDSVRARVRLPGLAPHAALATTAPPGPLQAPMDVALRLGPESVRFSGTLEGRVGGKDVAIPGGSVHLATVRLAGTGRVVPITEDAAPPEVTIETPAQGRLVPVGSVPVAGALRDDRTIVRVTVALDGAPESDVPFDRVPETGYLDDFVASFALSLDTVSGPHEVIVRGYDAGGNAGLAHHDFFAGTAPTDALDAGDAQGSAFPAWAVIDASGDVRRSLTPSTAVDGLRGSVAVTTSPTGLLALQPDGTVLALGDNTLGFLGNGTTDAASAPQVVTGITGATAVAAGGAFGVALRADGTVWTWGDGRSGALGDGTLPSTPRTRAARVEGLPVVRSIGAWSHGAIGVDVNGIVWVWGSGTSTGTLASPTRIDGPVDIVTAAAGYQGNHFLAVDATGDVWSWGINAYGECGRPGSGVLSPAKVSGISGAKAIACGRDHSLVLLADGTLLGMGRDIYGTLGDGAQTISTYGPPFAVPLIDQVVDVDAGFNSSLALRADGTVWAWGAINVRNVPTQVGGP